MDDDGATAAAKGSPKKISKKEGNKEDVDASLSSISNKDAKDKDGKPAGRARSRSIWGRSKK